MSTQQSRNVVKRRLLIGLGLALSGLAIAFLGGLVSHAILGREDPDEFGSAMLGYFVMILSGFPAGFYAVRKSYGPSNRLATLVVLANASLLSALLIALVLASDGGLTEIYSLVAGVPPYAGMTAWGAVGARSLDTTDKRRSATKGSKEAVS